METGFVVMDVGREIAILLTDFHTSSQMKYAVGRWMIARPASTGNSSKSFDWRLVEPQRNDPDLERLR
jgi:hypothetical protein